MLVAMGMPNEMTKGVAGMVAVYVAKSSAPLLLLLPSTPPAYFVALGEVDRGWIIVARWVGII